MAALAYALPIESVLTAPRDLVAPVSARRHCLVRHWSRDQSIGRLRREPDPGDLRSIPHLKLVQG